MQVSEEAIFSTRNIQVKDENVEEFWTQEVCTKDGTTEVKLEGQRFTAVQVLFGVKLSSIK